jgi:hypothetical protein
MSKSDKKNGCFTWPVFSYDLSRRSLFRMRIFPAEVVEKIRTHSMLLIFFFRKSCRLWDSVEKYGTAGQTTGVSITRCMSFACRIFKATDTHAAHVILLFLVNSGYANAPHCYVIRTLSVLLFFPSRDQRDTVMQTGYREIVSCKQVTF